MSTALVSPQPTGSAALDVAMSNLTTRELEVLGLIGEGLSIPEIAEKLYRSPKTVESHRLALGKKLGASNRVELAKFAIRAGLAKLSEKNSITIDKNLAVRHRLVAQTRAWQALERIEAATSQDVGPRYIRKLVLEISRALGVEQTIVCEYVPAKPGWARSLAAVLGGQLQDNVFYDLAPAPCNVVTREGWASFPSNLIEQFPDDADLHFGNTELQAYVGVRLDNAAGRPIGLLAVLHDAPLDEATEVLSILRFCGRRAAAELERIDMEERLRETNRQLEATVAARTAALAEREQRYRVLIETMTDGLCSMNIDGKIDLANDQLCNMLGQKREDIVGHPPTEFMRPEQARWFKDVQKMREVDQLTPYRIDLQRPDGSEIPTLVSPRSIYDDQGNYLGSFGVLKDLSGRVWPEEID